VKPIRHRPDAPKALVAIWVAALVIVGVWAPLALLFVAPWVAAIAWVLYRTPGGVRVAEAGYLETSRRRLVAR